MHRLLPCLLGLMLCSSCGAARSTSGPAPGKAGTETVTFTLRAEPRDAGYRIEDAAGQAHSGTLPFEGDLPVGPLRWTVSAANHRTESGEIDLHEATGHFACLDLPGQLVDCRVAAHLPVPPWTDRALDREKREGGPKALLLPPGTDEIWVAVLVGPSALIVYSRSTGEALTRIPLGDEGLGAVEFEITADGKTVYVSQLESSLIFEIDRASKRVLRSFSAFGEWPKILELSADETKLYVSNWSSGNIAEIELATGELARDLPGTVVPRGLYATRDGRFLYLAGFGSGEFRRIDLASGDSELLFQDTASLRHIVADEERGRFFISDLKNARILTFDLASGETRVFATVHPKPNTIRLSPDGRVLYVSSRGPNNPVNWLDPGPQWGAITLLDAETGESLDLVVAGNQPTAMDLSRDGRQLVVSDFIDNRIRLFDLPDTETLRSGEGGRATQALTELPKVGWEGWIPDNELPPPPEDPEDPEDPKE
ncbi:MAG: YncE family protein [Myxococcota bacterium]|nr:YncE family protein [Myxococcota bacterium]